MAPLLHNMRTCNEPATGRMLHSSKQWHWHSKYANKDISI